MVCVCVCVGVGVCGCVGVGMGVDVGAWVCVGRVCVYMSTRGTKIKF